MGAIKAAIGDGVITFLWMFCVSTVGPLTAVISKHLEIQSPYFALGIAVLLITVLILIFNPISDALGKASFNPANTAAFYAAGIGEDSLFAMALRFPAQALGAVGGVLAIREVMPTEFKSMLSGPSLKVDLHTGALAEGILTFVITFAVLWIIIKGPSNAVVKTLMLATTTVTMVVSGSTYTGPSMNPINYWFCERVAIVTPREEFTDKLPRAVRWDLHQLNIALDNNVDLAKIEKEKAYGWAYIDNRHNTWEQFYVYWIPSFTGAILAAWVFRLIFLQSSAKVKKA